MAKANLLLFIALTSKICHVYYNEILYLQTDSRAGSKSTLKSQTTYNVVFLVVVTDEDYVESHIISFRSSMC